MELYIVTFTLGVTVGLFLSILVEWLNQKEYNKIKQAIFDAETNQWEKEKEE